MCPTLCDPMDCSPPGSLVHGDSPGKNTGTGFHALLQGLFPTQGSNPGLPHCRQILYRLSHQGRNSLGMGIFVITNRPVSWPGAWPGSQGAWPGSLERQRDSPTHQSPAPRAALARYRLLSSPALGTCCSHEPHLPPHPLGTQKPPPPPLEI